MPNRKVNNKRLTSGICAVLVILTILTTALAGGVLAKYVKNNLNADRVIAAKEFYFTSNFLAEDGENYVISPDVDGTASITFTVGNNADKLRYAEDDISYTVSVNNSDCVIEGGTGILTGDTLSASSITIGNMQKGKTYTITATGTAGYKQTLTATVTVAGEDVGVYKSITQNNDYVLLTVWTKNVKGDLTITYPAGLIPDNTDAAMRSVKSTDRTFIDTSSFDNAYSSHTYRFFIETINGSKPITVNSFNVTCGDEPAVVATPE